MIINRRLVFVFFCIVMVINCLGNTAVNCWAQEINVTPFVLNPQDRILVVSPHPDDEVLGCAGVIQKAVSMGVPVHIVFLTNGDSNQWSFLLYRKHPVVMPKAVTKMGMVRHDEAVAAAQILGLSPEKDLTFLGYPDFGMINIWYSHWANRPPLRSILTRATTVPYKDSLRYKAPHKGEDILQDLGMVIDGFKPTKVFVSHPADHNGDHLAAYLFTRVALWNLWLEKKVKIFPYLIHRVGWPTLKGLHPDKNLDPPELSSSEITWSMYALTEQEVEVKMKALKAHKSQYQSTPKYLMSFIRTNELFGDFPVIHLPVNTPDLASVYQEKESKQMPEELTDDERAHYVGVEWQFVRLQEDHFVVSIKLSQPLTERVGASVYIFGYRYDRPFGQMPKLHIKLWGTRYSVYDQTKNLPKKNVEVSHRPDEITIQVPLSMLGYPQNILTSARTYSGNIPLDWASWRVIELSQGQKR